MRYRDAGVDLDVAEEVTAGIARHLRGALFGGFLPVPQLKRYQNPVLVSSIDGVGTKVRLASLLSRVDGLGEDIVHHCVNDIAVHGAEPLLFMDYLAMHRLDGDLVQRIVAGIASACTRLGIALAGGETAEMPAVYGPDQLDLAGAIVGAVEAEAVIDGRDIQPGDVMVGLPSSGLHTNGYSLVLRMFGEEEYERYEPALGTTLGEALLTPHRCYLEDIRDLLAMEPPLKPISPSEPSPIAAASVPPSASGARGNAAPGAVPGEGADPMAGRGATEGRRYAGTDSRRGDEFEDQRHGAEARGYIAANSPEETAVPSAAVHGLAHITGGGIAGNLSRVLPAGMTAVVNLPEPPSIFAFLEERGVPHDEMLRVFNMGIGLIAVCERSVLERVPNSYQVIGEIESGERGVQIV